MLAAQRQQWRVSAACQLPIGGAAFHFTHKGLVGSSAIQLQQDPSWFDSSTTLAQGEARRAGTRTLKGPDPSPGMLRCPSWRALLSSLVPSLGHERKGLDRHVLRPQRHLAHAHHLQASCLNQPEHSGTRPVKGKGRGGAGFGARPSGCDGNPPLFRETCLAPLQSPNGLGAPNSARCARSAV